MSMSLREDFRSAAEFEEHPREALKHARRTGRPVVITRKGKLDVVILDAAVFEERLKIANLSRFLAEADVRAGRVRPVDEFWRELDRAETVSR